MADPSRSWDSATTRTFSTGCGRTGCARVSRRDDPGASRTPEPASTRFTNAFFERGWLLTAGRFAVEPRVVDGGVLLLETSEELIPAREFGGIAVASASEACSKPFSADVVVRPPTTDFDQQSSTVTRNTYRNEQRDVVIDITGRYHPEAVVVVGTAIGPTRSQRIVAYGGQMTVHREHQRTFADYN